MPIYWCLCLPSERDSQCVNYKHMEYFMAGDHSNYVHGEMDVGDHRKTFGGFMAGSVYGGALIALIVIMPVLIFGVGMAWLPALLMTLVIGVILGIALKLKGGWYASIIALAIFTAILCMIISALV